MKARAVVGGVFGLLAGVAVFVLAASTVHVGDYMVLSDADTRTIYFGLAAVPLLTGAGAFLGWKANARR